MRTLPAAARPVSRSDVTSKGEEEGRPMTNKLAKIMRKLLAK